jgi:hypothetical protein
MGLRVQPSTAGARFGGPGRTGGVWDRLAIGRAKRTITKIVGNIKDFAIRLGSSARAIILQNEGNSKKIDKLLARFMQEEFV